MTWTAHLRRTGYRVAYTLLRLYWFVVQPQVTGTLCLLVCEQRLLLIRNTYGSRSWTFPGGMLKRGESPETAVRREVYEEVGIGLDTMQNLGAFTGRQAYRRDTVYVFAAQVLSPDIQIDPGEIWQACWFPLASLPPLSFYARRALQLWQR